MSKNTALSGPVGSAAETILGHSIEPKKPKQNKTNNSKINQTKNKAKSQNNQKIQYFLPLDTSNLMTIKNSGYTHFQDSKECWQL